MEELSNRVAIVTGASSGIGKTIAQTFVKAGARVVLVSNELEALNETAKELSESGGVCTAIEADITKEEDVIKLHEKTLNLFGRIDLLVNNAGVATSAAIDEISFQDWQKVIDVNLTGAFLCSRESFIVMKQQSGGRIINIGSVSSKVPRPGSLPYVASKAGLEGLTKSLALEGREFSITASILYLGNTMSGFWEKSPEVAAQEGVMSKETVAKMVLNVASMPDDVLVMETTLLPVNMPFLGRG